MYISKLEIENYRNFKEFSINLKPLTQIIGENKRQHNIYNEVTQLLENMNFLHLNIKLREEVRVNIDDVS